MNFKQKMWRTSKNIVGFFKSDELKRKASLFKGSVVAILFGFIIAGLLITTQGQNPFQYFYDLFKLTEDHRFKTSTVMWIAVFMISGTAIAVGFKAGLFNIGGTGQALVGFLISLVISQNYYLKHQEYMSNSSAVLFFIIFVLSGAVCGAISGLLKALFNVHEVVSSIMVNWVVWYVLKNVVNANPEKYGANGGSQTTALLPQEYFFINGQQSYLIPILIAIGAMVIIMFVMYFTTLGFKLRAIGHSKTAARYAGYNSVFGITISMIISGSLMGIAGFILYFGLQPSISLQSDTLPTLGFDALAVALVPFNNFLGIVPIAVLWGIIKNNSIGASVLNGNISNQISSVMFGLIIYAAAIATLMMRFSPIKWTQIWIYIKSNFSLRKNIFIYKKNIKTARENILSINYINKFAELKLSTANDQQFNELIKLYKEIIELKLNLKNNKIKLNELQNIFNDKKYKYINDNKQNINSKYKIQILNSSRKLISYVNLSDRLKILIEKYCEYLKIKKENINKQISYSSKMNNEELKENILKLRNDNNDQFNSFKNDYNSFIEFYKTEILKNKLMMKSEICVEFANKKNIGIALYKNYYNIMQNKISHDATKAYDQDILSYRLEKNTLTNEWNEKTIQWKNDLKNAKIKLKIKLRLEKDIYKRNFNSLYGISEYNDNLNKLKFSWLEIVDDFDKQLSILKENYLINKKNESDVNLIKNLIAKYKLNKEESINNLKSIKKSIASKRKTLHFKYKNDKMQVEKKKVDDLIKTYNFNKEKLLKDYSKEANDSFELKAKNINFKKEIINIDSYKKSQNDLKNIYKNKIKLLIDTAINKINKNKKIYRESKPYYSLAISNLKKEFNEQLKIIKANQNDYSIKINDSTILYSDFNVKAKNISNEFFEMKWGKFND
ncbi:ABC transporter permease [Spiroplasma endosymbiont of Labia minor]|uniref:ABC transporter permease n=1 Tax=Spiroplasma endosymbiont of Labia minor TaxID=3066305 RepID=UPI0030D271A9